MTVNQFLDNPCDRFAGPPKDQPSSPVEFPEQRRQAEITELIYRAYVADEAERERRREELR